MIEITRDVGAALTEAIAWSGMNQSEIAKKVGCTRQAIQQAAAPGSKKDIRVGTLLKILDVIGMKIVIKKK